MLKNDFENVCMRENITCTAPSTSNVTNKRVRLRLLLISKCVCSYTVYTVLALIINECPEQQTRLKTRLFVTLDVDGAVSYTKMTTSLCRITYTPEFHVT